MLNMVEIDVTEKIELLANEKENVFKELKVKQKIK